MPEVIDVFGLQIVGPVASIITYGFGFCVFATAVAIAFAWSVYDEQIRQSRNGPSDPSDDLNRRAVEDLQLRTNT